MIPDPVADARRPEGHSTGHDHSPVDAHELPLGTILAGGESRRFGSHKALAQVGGLTLVRRVRDALCAVVPDPVLITGRPELYASLDLPSRRDVGPGGGPLAGLHTALLWSRERNRAGVLVVACDLPFLHPELLRRIVRHARDTSAAAVVPEGPGRFGIEPLCAWYSLDALPEVQTRLERGDLSVGRLLQTLDAARIPLRDVRDFGDPEVLFHNVNTRADQAVAEEIARGTGEPDGPI